MNAPCFEALKIYHFEHDSNGHIKTKTLKEEGQMENQTWVETMHRYSRGDREAMDAVDKAVKERMRSIGGDYQAAFNSLQRDARQSTFDKRYQQAARSPSATDADRRAASEFIAQQANAIQRRSSCDYSTAIRRACYENPKMGETYLGYAIDDRFRVSCYANETDTSTKFTMPITQVSNIVAGLPKLANGSANLALAVQILNGDFRDLVSAACREMIEIIASPTSKQMPGFTSQNLPEARLQARAAHPELARVADGQPVSENALKDLLQNKRK